MSAYLRAGSNRNLYSVVEDFEHTLTQEQIEERIELDIWDGKKTRTLQREVFEGSLAECVERFPELSPENRQDYK